MFLALHLKSATSLVAMVPFIAKYYLETRVWGTGELVAMGLSLFLGFFSGILKNCKIVFLSLRIQLSDCLKDPRNSVCVLILYSVQSSRFLLFLFLGIFFEM